VDVSPQQVYQIEYTTDLLAPDWHVFSTFTNAATTERLEFKLDDPLPAGDRSAIIV
jgi:hypothetical protein